MDSGEWGSKISGNTRQRLESAVTKAKAALKTDDATAINSARDELMQAFSAAGQEMYQAQAQQAQEPQGGAPPEPEPSGRPAGGRGGEDEVVEADYEIVDEEK